MNQYDVAEYCEKMCGVHIIYDESDECFICPVCDEPIIYKSDWENDKKFHLEKEVCLICQEKTIKK